jgi:shikimate kinase
MFIKAAGLTFCGLAVGSQLLSAVLVSTGLGYGAAMALDAATCGSIAYAVGGTAKAHFKGERDQKQLKREMRDAFKKRKQQQAA